MKHESLASLEKALTQDILNAVGSNDQLRKLIGQEESQKVQSEVYDKNEPSRYKRRGLADGLADPDNIERTSISSNGNKIQLIYENTTEGVDTLKGKELADTIEEGLLENWSNPNGIWSSPRPFIEPTIESLKNDNKLRDELVSILKKAGMDVK
jgi:hypothetical protein